MKKRQRDFRLLPELRSLLGWDRHATSQRHFRHFRIEALERRYLLAADLGAELLPAEETPAVVADELLGQTESHAAASSLIAEGESATDLATFAQALTDAGVKFYGWKDCPHCIQQEQLFGEAIDLVPFIPVATTGTDGLPVLNDLGIELGITRFPTWEFPDNDGDGQPQRVEGFLTIEQLAQNSGISAPIARDINVFTFQTNAGDITIRLLPGVAPNTVDNFLNYLNRGDYIDTIFHRADENSSGEFVVQGGGFTTTDITSTVVAPQPDGTPANWSHIDTDPPIPNEPNSFQNVLFSVAMAKNSLGATSEFFFNTNDNRGLDSPGNDFTVFAILEGQSAVVDSSTTVGRIAQFETMDLDGFRPPAFVFDRVPFTPEGEMVVIQSVTGDGMIQGTAFDDTNGNGVFDAGDSVLAGITIFSDADGDGLLDANEASTTTDASGNYEMILEAGSHSIKQVISEPFSQSLPTSSLGYTIEVEIGRTIEDLDFGRTQVSVPNAPVLLAETDSGQTGDNLTNFNNNSTARTLQFSVDGVTNGALVTLFINNVPLGEATAANGVATITTEPTLTLIDGSHVVTATQTIGDAESPVSQSLVIQIDTSVSFSSTPPVAAEIGTPFVYNAESPEESLTGVTYALAGTVPASASINPSTGVMSWTPVASDLGLQQFDVTLTDQAGNMATQTLRVSVEGTPDLRFTLQLVDSDGNEISQIAVGESFSLNVLAEDSRVTAPQDQFGVFAAFLDIFIENQLVSVAGPIVHNPDFNFDPSGNTDQPGLIDEVGGVTTDVFNLANGRGPHLIATIPFTAVTAGTEVFRGDPPDVKPQHENLFGNPTGAIADDQIFFGVSTLQIGSSITVTGETFNVDEDSNNNPLNVLANDSDSSGGNASLTISNFSDPGDGATLTIAADNRSLIYTPPADFFGQQTFTYDVTDGISTEQATATVQVQPFNDVPIANDDLFTVAGGSQDVLIDVIQNDTTGVDSQAEKSDYRVISTTPTSGGGTVTPGSNGRFLLYTPAPGFVGTDTFNYTVQDAGGATATAAVNINVDAENNPPTARDDTATVVEDSQDNPIDVIGNDDTEPDSDETITLVGAINFSAGGTAEVVNNQFLYTPAPNFTGTETFTYQINDSSGASASAQVSVTVTNTDDPPVATDDPSLVAVRNQADQTLDVLNNDVHPDPTATVNIIEVGTTNNGGTVTIAADGQSLLYTPATDFSGSETFTYTIRDDEGQTAEATATVEVREFVPSNLSGFVYIDSNNNGVKEDSELPVGGVTITLMGTNDLNETVSETTTTAMDGSYSFANLAPGSYTIKQTHPTMLIDGIDTPGSQGGSSTVNDEIAVELLGNVTGTDNNFGERGREAAAITMLDFVNTNGQDRLLVATDTTNGPLWYAAEQGWSGVTAFEARVTGDETNVELTATDTSGNEQTITVPIDDTARVQCLVHDDNTYLVRVLGSAADLFGFTTTTAAESNGESAAAEAESTGSTAAAEGEDASGLSIANAVPEPLIVTPSTTQSTFVSTAATENTDPLPAASTLQAEGEFAPLFTSDFDATSILIEQGSLDDQPQETDAAAAEQAIDVVLQQFGSEEEAATESSSESDTGSEDEEEESLLALEAVFGDELWVEVE